MYIDSNTFNNQKFIEYISKTYDIKTDTKIRLKDIFDDNWDDFLDSVLLVVSLIS